jgi:hypothetical protein
MINKTLNIIKEFNTGSHDLSYKTVWTFPSSGINSATKIQRHNTDLIPFDTSLD